MTAQSLWNRFEKYLLRYQDLGFTLDISRMRFGNDFLAAMQPKVERALADMKALEAGAIANPDENRMVGHYWLRNPALAPTPEMRLKSSDTKPDISQFAAEVHTRKDCRAGGRRFTDVWWSGIGGSALGPQFVSDALGTPRQNDGSISSTTPTRTASTRRFENRTTLAHTLTVVISKSGGTKETRNGMLEAEARYRRGLDFAKHAVAVTGAEANSTRWPRKRAG